MDNQQIADIIYLIKQSLLDETIKQILIRDLENEGLTDFMKEQIKVYCLEGIKQIDERISQAKQLLEQQPQNPPA